MEQDDGNLFPPVAEGAELDALMEILADLELDTDVQRAHHHLQGLEAALEVFADLELDADRNQRAHQDLQELRTAQEIGADLVLDGDLEQE
ncbi:hypothetical protein PF010_g31538 [Phytophthora fragariae]|nr:hypothetical protein PF003_g11654 [Phytophthora fragariae]KAE9057013.1 hypothetical protein PF010_g31538 [Phytophthora fragariae]KAE9160133.1 hypothetical protein PF004_g31286 [Phytophthora fragariae]KAE9160349.1 hypothetical protein PF002_g32639 [Phytophthora fragariae]KAE9270871.1 hypothetical protein PF008_g30495 [Phytophthora fragariae]